MNTRALGIDLGTTYSAMAFVNDAGDPRIVPNAEGGRTTPSVVLVEGNRILVGDVALNRAGRSPDLVVRWVKRAMGSPEYRFLGMDAVEISAEILRKLRSDAYRYLGEPVSAAVVTCPAYFSSQEIKATQAAGELAGLKVLEVVKEPTAAAVFYGIEHLGEGERLLVYDLGGGTFDATVLCIEGGWFTPVASAGDRRLGGHDWTSDLVNYVCDQLAERHLPDPRGDASAEHRLYEQCEHAKRMLSELTEVSIPCVCRDEVVEIDVSRSELEGLTEWRVGRTLTCVTGALSKASPPLSWSDIDKVLLVGGATRMPSVADALRAVSGTNPIATGEEDTMVALGAAILARGEMRATTPGSGLSAREHPMGIVPVNYRRTAARTLGTKVIVWEDDGPSIRNSAIIGYGTHLPARVAREDYRTSAPGQRFVDVPVVEFDDFGPEVVLGTFRFALMPNTPAGAPVTVAFAYDGSGIAEVTATDGRTGQLLPSTEAAYEAPDLRGMVAAARQRWVVVALDTSGSMLGGKMARATQAAASSVRTVSEAGRHPVWFGLVTFGSAVVLRCEPSGDPAAVARCLQSVSAAGSTPMHSAIRLALDTLRKAPTNTACEIALVTDGMPDDPEAALAAAEEARAEGVSLSIVGIGKEDVDEEFLRQLTPRTLTVDSAQQVGDALVTLLTEPSGPAERSEVVLWARNGT
jgi:molecular chaperone DnaK